jgi:hypothetical protein
MRREPSRTAPLRLGGFRLLQIEARRYLDSSSRSPQPGSSSTQRASGVNPRQIAATQHAAVLLVFLVYLDQLGCCSRRRNDWAIESRSAMWVLSSFEGVVNQSAKMPSAVGT